MSASLQRYTEFISNGQQVSESDPIRVHPRAGRWLVSYAKLLPGNYDTRAEVIEVATAAASSEQRELTIEPKPRR